MKVQAPYGTVLVRGNTEENWLESELLDWTTNFKVLSHSRPRVRADVAAPINIFIFQHVVPIGHHDLIISVSLFKETVLRPIRSGPRKVSPGLVISVFKSKIILTLGADEAASIYLSNDTNSAGGHAPDAVPEAPRLLGMRNGKVRKIKGGNDVTEH
ncbi:hypothetical protein BDR07DRAFT_1464409 [Suillus spraguei]|nr:hypothetical protein BDR07DRAFT_1464409 [Suillus spraguei]